MEIQKPGWCKDKNCSPLVNLGVEPPRTDNFATCVGKLDEPGDHGDKQGVNDLQWCIRSEGFTCLQINQHDCIAFTLLLMEALHKDNQPFPQWMIDHMQRKVC